MRFILLLDWVRINKESKMASWANASRSGHNSVLLALLDKCNDSEWRLEDAQGRTAADVAKQNNKKNIAQYLQTYKPIRSNHDWLGWALMPPYLIIMMGLAPSYPWFALAAVLFLGLYCLTPWRGYLFNLDKTYYLFVGLTGFSLVVNVKQAGDYLGTFGILVGVIPNRDLGASVEFGLHAALTLTAAIFYALAIFTNPGLHIVNKAKDDKVK